MIKISQLQDEIFPFSPSAEEEKILKLSLTDSTSATEAATLLWEQQIEVYKLLLKKMFQGLTWLINLRVNKKGNLISPVCFCEPLCR